MILRLARIVSANMSVLHVAQKNSIAKEVANILSRLNKRTIPTLSKFNPVFQFQLQSKTHHFTSVRGHVFDYQLPQQCKNWRSFDNKKILFSQTPIIKKLGPDMNDVVNNLSRLAREHKQLILWLDCDRQGQAIAFQVIQICTKINPRLTIKRARFSAVTPVDIWNAYNGLVNPNKLQADAVNYRIQIDFRSGCSFTRYQTVVFQSYFQAQNGVLLSYGPCQMPTLSFVVERYLQIKNFKPQKYWFIEMICVISDKIGIPFTWQKKNTRNQIQANQAIYRILSAFPDGNVMATVKNRKVSPKKRYRPYPLTTVKFQKIATDKLKMSSAQAMSIAEKLYQNGLISYPRTETNAFPKTMNLKTLLQRFQNSQQYGNYVDKLMQHNKYVAPKAGNSNDQAHTPIHPVKMVQKNKLTNDEWRVYDLIVRSFLACCSGDAIGQQYEVKADAGGQLFKASYQTIKQHNYLQIYSFQKWIQTSFPAQIPQKFPVLVTLKDSKTTPPGYLTQSQLIDLMQKNQIGTDSTIHQHIQTIQKRQYAVKTNNTLKPTNLGASLVQTYKQLQISLPQCQIRRKIQQKMNKIAEGQVQKTVATQQTLNQMIPIYQKLMSVKEQWLATMKKYMQTNFQLKKVQVQQKGQIEQQNQHRKAPFQVCKCPKCQQGQGNVRFSQKNQSYFLGCSKYPSCRWTQSLPSYIQQIKQTQKQCQKCNSRIVQITPKQGKTIEPLMIRMQFQQSQSGTLQVCLNLRCNTDFYQYINQFGFNSSNPNNTNNNTANNINLDQRSNFYNSNQNSNHFQTNNRSTNNRYVNNRNNSQNSNQFSKTKFNRSNTANYQNNNKNKNVNKYYGGNSQRNENSGKKQIICFRCRQPGHIAPNCPNNGGNIQKRINDFLPNSNGNYGGYNKYQKKNNFQNKSNEEGGQNQKKVCKQCGIQGRHPRGSQCPSVVRKRKQKQ